MSANRPLNTQHNPSEVQGVRASDPAWSGLSIWTCLETRWWGGAEDEKAMAGEPLAC